MVPTLDALLAGAAYATERTLMPELTSKFARTQALAILQNLAVLRDRVEHRHESLLDETASLRDGLEEIRAGLDGTAVVDRSAAAEGIAAIRAQLGRAYPEHRGQRTIAGLEQERVDLRALHVRLLKLLTEGPAFDDPALKALRDRLRPRYVSTYGYTVSFTPVWAE